jgi:hypothetical protein
MNRDLTQREKEELEKRRKEAAEDEAACPRYSPFSDPHSIWYVGGRGADLTPPQSPRGTK